MVQIAELQVAITADKSGLDQGVQGAQDSIQGLAGSAALLSGSKAIGGFFGDSLKLAGDFEFQMDAVQASLGRIDPSVMADIAAQAEEIGSSSQYTASEIGGIQEAMAKMGVTADDMLSGATQGVVDLAAATGEDLVTSAQVASAALNQFGLDGSQMTNVADTMTAALNNSSASLPDFATGMNHLGPVMSSLGFSFEDSAAAIAYFNTFGMKAADVGVSVARMFNELASPTSTARAEMDRLGISAFDLEGNMLPLPDIMDNLSQAFDGMSQQQQLDLVSKIFGAESADVVLRAIQEGGDGLRAMREEVTANGQAADAAATRMDNLWGSVEEFGGATDAARQNMTEGFLPSLKGIVDAGTEAVNFFNDLPPEMQAATGAAIALAAALAGVVGVMAGWSVISGPVTAGLSTLAGVLTGPLLAGLAAAGLGIAAYQNNWFGVGDAVDGAVDATKQAIKTFKTTRQGLKAAGYSELTADVKAFGSALDELGWDGAAEKVNQLGTIMKVTEDQFEIMLASGINPLTAGLWSLAAGIEQVAGDNGLTDWLRNAGTFADTLGTQFETMRNSGIDPVTAGLWSLAAAVDEIDGEGNVAAGLVEGLRRAGEATRTFGDLFAGATQAGLNPFHAALIAGLGAVEDLAGGTTGVTSAIRNLANAVQVGIPAFEAMFDYYTAIGDPGIVAGIKAAAAALQQSTGVDFREQAAGLAEFVGRIGDLAGAITAGDWQLAADTLGGMKDQIVSSIQDAFGPEGIDLGGMVVNIGSWALGTVASIGDFLAGVFSGGGPGPAGGADANGIGTNRENPGGAYGAGITVSGLLVNIKDFVLGDIGPALGQLMSDIGTKIQEIWTAPDAEMLQGAEQFGNDIGTKLGEFVAKGISAATEALSNASIPMGGVSEYGLGGPEKGAGFGADLINWGDIFTGLMTGMDEGFAEAAGPATEELVAKFQEMWEQFKADLVNDFKADLTAGTDPANDPLVQWVQEWSADWFADVQTAMLKAAGSFDGPAGGADANGIGTNREVSNTLAQDLASGIGNMFSGLGTMVKAELDAELADLQGVSDAIGGFFDGVGTTINDAMNAGAAALRGNAQTGGMTGSGPGGGQGAAAGVAGGIEVGSFLTDTLDTLVQDVVTAVQDWDPQAEFDEVAAAVGDAFSNLGTSINEAINRGITTATEGTGGGMTGSGPGGGQGVPAGASSVVDVQMGVIIEGVVASIVQAGADLAAAVAAIEWPELPLPEIKFAPFDSAGAEDAAADYETLGGTFKVRQGSPIDGLIDAMFPSAGAAGLEITPDQQARIDSEVQTMADSLATAVAGSLSSPEFAGAFETAVKEQGAENFAAIGQSLSTAIQDGLTTALQAPESLDVGIASETGPVAGAGGNMANALVNTLSSQLAAGIAKAPVEQFQGIGGALSSKIQQALQFSLQAPQQEAGKAVMGTGGDMGAGLVTGLATSIATSITSAPPETFAAIGTALQTKITEVLSTAMAGGQGGIGAPGATSTGGGTGGGMIATSLVASLAAQITSADFSAVGTAIQTKISEVLSTALSGGGNSMGGPGERGEAGTGLGDGLVQSIVTQVTGSSAWSTLTTTFQTKGTEAATAFGTGLGTGMATAVTSIMGSIAQLSASLTAFATTAQTAGQTAGTGFGTGIGTGMATAVTAVQGAVAQVMATLTAAATEAQAAGTTAGTGWRDGLVTGMAEAISAVQGAVAQVIATLDSAAATAEASGAAVSAGFAAGIRSGIEDISAAAGEAAAAGTVGISQTIDEGSPSRVTRKSGVNFGLGFIEGIRSQIAGVAERAREMAQGATGATQSAAAAAGTSLQQTGEEAANKFLDGLASRTPATVDRVRELIGRALKEADSVLERWQVATAKHGMLGGIAEKQLGKIDNPWASPDRYVELQEKAALQRIKEREAERIANQEQRRLDRVGEGGASTGANPASTGMNEMASSAQQAEGIAQQAMQQVVGSLGQVGDAAQQAGQDLSQSFGDAAGSMTGDLQATDAAANQMTGSLDAASGAATNLGTSMQDVGAATANVGTVAGQALDQFEASLAEMPAAARAIGEDVLASLREAFGGGGGQTGAALAQPINDAIGEAAAQTVPAAQQAGQQVGSSYETGLASSLFAANRTAAQQISEIKSYFQSIQQYAQGAGAQTGAGFAEGIADAQPAKEAGKTLSDLSKTISSNGNQAAGAAQEAGLTIGQNLADGINRSGTEAIRTATQVQNRVNSQLGGTFDQVDLGKVDTGSVVSTVNSTLSRLRGIDGSKQGNSVGATFGQGLASGASSKSSVIQQAVKELIDDAYAAGKKAAEAKSPSKRFAELGGFLVAGVGVGIDQNRMQALGAMRSLVGDLEHEAALLNPTLGNWTIGDTPTLPPLVDGPAPVGARGEAPVIYQTIQVEGSFGTGEEWDTFMHDRAQEAAVTGAR